MMNVSRCLSEELANVSVPVEQPASRVGTETGLVRVQRDRVRTATSSAGIFKQSMWARNRAGLGLSYRLARLHRLAELLPWNRFLGPSKV
jgi:hypothetical protein